MIDNELHEWENLIRNWALDLGFVRAGFTTSDELTGLALVLKQRQLEGWATPFESVNYHQRTNPRTIWPACQSVAALAYPITLSTGAGKGEGSIARSAVGADYHIIMTGKIQTLIQLMIAHNWPGAKPRFQVDTGPLVERAFAARAGLGWLGRNRQLIVPGYGSFVALSLILFDQPLPADLPLTNCCGTCRACVDACPAAVLGQQDYNGQRCISYLTQSKEPLMTDQRALLNGRIFGCDTCQEVCPYNKERLNAEPLQNDYEQQCRGNEAIKDFDSYPHRGVDLWQTLNMSKQEFQDRFKFTAAGWRGKTVLQRNALLALRQIGDPGLSAWETKQKEAVNLSPLLRPYLDSADSN